MPLHNQIVNKQAYNPRATLNNANNQGNVKRVTPVRTGGIWPIHVGQGVYSLQDRINYTRQLIQNTPGATPYQIANGGLPVTHASGIIPFIRTLGGKIFAPGSK
jgi:hypothetical protein